MSLPMTDEEIRTSYRDAAYKGKQIHVLAQLNATNEATICKILGLDSKPTPTVRVTPKSKIDGKTAMAMYLDGKPDKEIAEHFGVITDAVAKWRKRNSLAPVDKTKKTESKPAIAKTDTKHKQQSTVTLVETPPYAPQDTSVSYAPQGIPIKTNPLADLMPTELYRGYLTGQIIDLLLGGTELAHARDRLDELMALPKA